jgi:hypothetical protein
MRQVTNLVFKMSQQTNWYCLSEFFFLLFLTFNDSLKLLRYTESLVKSLKKNTDLNNDIH